MSNMYELDRDKVKKFLRTKDGQWTEQWICALHDITMQTYTRRCKVGWNREQLIALASTINGMQSKVNVKYTDLIDLGGAGE